MRASSFFRIGAVYSRPGKNRTLNEILKNFKMEEFLL